MENENQTSPIPRHVHEYENHRKIVWPILTALLVAIALIAGMLFERAYGVDSNTDESMVRIQKNKNTTDQMNNQNPLEITSGTKEYTSKDMGIMFRYPEANIVKEEMVNYSGVETKQITVLTKAEAEKKSPEPNPVAMITYFETAQKLPNVKNYTTLSNYLKSESTAGSIKNVKPYTGIAGATAYSYESTNYDIAQPAIMIEKNGKFYEIVTPYEADTTTISAAQQQLIDSITFNK